MLPKSIAALIGSGEKGGSRRVQLAAVCLGLILNRPDLALPVTTIAVALVASLTLTDLAERD